MAIANHPGPGEFADAITPHDTNALTRIPRAVYIGNGGDLTVGWLATDGVTILSVLFAGLRTGTILPVRPQIVLATGTSATQLVAIY